MQLWVAGHLSGCKSSPDSVDCQLSPSIFGMMGMAIEENFMTMDGKNLMDFWSRWHITLSSWCRDYVYNMSVAITRRPDCNSRKCDCDGLWHDASIYYVLWGIWQGLGIIVAYVMVKSTWGWLLCELKPLIEIDGAFLVEFDEACM